MILVDTSIWVDHLRSRQPRLAALLDDAAVLGHPWVTGELALGSMTQRDTILGLLANLPQAAVATPDEVLTMVRLHRLHGRGIGYVDAQLAHPRCQALDRRPTSGRSRRRARRRSKTGEIARQLKRPE
jgi:predicted nucleic acid-binding protein